MVSLFYKFAGQIHSAMFFILSKILDLFLKPLTWFIILLVLSILIKNKKHKKRLIRITLAMVVFFTNPFISKEAIRTIETSPVSVSNLDTAYDLGIVLGGGMIDYDAKNKRKIFRHNTDRIMQAIWLYKKNIINKILISGGAGTISYSNNKESKILKDFFVEIGLPPHDILIETQSNNTYENAEFTASMLEGTYPNGSFLLITSATHINRAKKCFLKAGVDVDTYPVGHISGPRKWDVKNLLFPNYEALKHWDIFFHEIFGLLTYRFMGYI